MSSGGAYDPDAVDDKPRGSYLSKKDLRNLAAVLVIVFLILIPVYNHLKEDANKHRCAGNFKSMGDAMGLYMAENNDRFPPAYIQTADGFPLLQDGHPVTWAGIIRPYMPARYNFVCPSAHESEYTIAAHPTDRTQTLPMTYGMYVARSAASRSSMSNPGLSVLLSETSAFGARDTLNPVPFAKDGVDLKYDGFLIGYDNTNLPPSFAEPNTQALFVSRLAFPGTKNKEFTETGPARHNKGNHFLYADGSLRTLPPTAARIERMGKERMVGLWSDD